MKTYEADLHIEIPLSGMVNISFLLCALLKDLKTCTNILLITYKNSANIIYCSFYIIKYFNC